MPFADLLCAPDAGALSRADAAIEADDAALIIYTSGTTGRPKGVVLTHRVLAAYAGYAERVGLFAAGDRILIQVPLPTAASSVTQTVSAISLGATLILLDVFRAETSLELVEAERVTCYVAPPTMLTLQLEAENFEVVDLSSLRHVITGAAPVAAALAERVVGKMDVRLTNSYGATETGGLVTYVPRVAPERRATETCGVVIPGYELRIVDEDRGQVEPGQVGEVAVRGAPVMAGYHRAPEPTAEVLDEDGWWYSGDLGTLDEDGYLRIDGRAKDMYIRGGYKVYPAEVEAVLERHPPVVACAVVGYDDPVLGEKGRAFVVAARGPDEDRLSADELRELCRRDLADYRLPDDARFVDKLPLIGPRKVDRAVLRGAA